MTANASRRERSEDRSFFFGSRLVRWGFIVLMMWVLALAGCGGDDTGDTGEIPDSTADGTPPKSDATVKDSTADVRADADSGSVALPDAAPDRVTTTSDAADATVTTPDAPVTIPDSSTPDTSIPDTSTPPDARADVTPPPVDARVDVVVDAPIIVDVRTSDVSDAPVIVIPPDADAGPAPVVLVSVSVTRPNGAIANGTSEQFTATGTYSDTSTHDISSTVTWSSSATGVATVDVAGMVHAAAVGTTTITATQGAISGSVGLTVNTATLASIAITPPLPTIADGTQVQLTAIGTFTDNTTQNLTNAVTWASASTGVATVSGTGLATAQGTGTSSISATSGAVVGSTTLTVSSATLVSISTSPARQTIVTNTTIALTATGIYTNGSRQDLTTQVTWSSTAGAIASISNDPGSQGVASGLTAGATNIRATLVTGGVTVTGTTTLNVNSATLQSIAVTPSSSSIAAGTDLQFQAIGTFVDDVAPHTVRTQDITRTATWSSSAAGVASISNADGSRGLAHGEVAAVTAVTITASQVTTGPTTISGTASLTVNSALLQNITLSPSAPTIANGTTVQFTATGVYSDTSTHDLTLSVTWGSLNPGVATVSNGGGTNGLATGLSAGIATITATSGGITVHESLTVTAATLASINVTPTSPTIAKGSRQQFVATGVYTDNSTQDLTASVAWTSGDTNIASINAGGEATGVDAGTVTITATGSSGATPVTGTATLHVTAATLSSVLVSPANPIIAQGTTLPFTVQGTYSDGSTQDLTTLATWGSSAPSVASVSNASGSQGIATGLVQGTTTITATVGTFSNTTTLAVTAATLSSIAITPVNPFIAKGTTLQFRATGTYSDGSTQDITTGVAWRSSAGAVATIGNGASTHGFSTGIAAGTTTIQATSGNRIGSTTLTVTNATLSSIIIAPGSLTIARGTSQQFTATGTYSDGSTQNITAAVTWASDDTAVATVSSGGGTSGLATAVGQGTAGISATLGLVTRTVFLGVNPAALDHIDVSPVDQDIASGTTQQYVATGVYTDTTTQDLTPVASWTSSVPGVAVISNAAGTRGLATAISSTGSPTVITATFGGVSGHTNLAVHTATLDSITVSTLTPSIASGTTAAFHATAHYSDGTDVDVTTQVTWASDTVGVATVDANGVATSLMPGTATISAMLGASGPTDSALLTVTVATIRTIAISPLARNIFVGDVLQFTALGTYTDNTTQDITTVVTWSTDNTSVALISNADGSEGLATGVSVGLVNVTATSGAATTSTTLNVTAAP